LEIGFICKEVARNGRGEEIGTGVVIGEEAAAVEEVTGPSSTADRFLLGGFDSGYLANGSLRAITGEVTGLAAVKTSTNASERFSFRVRQLGATDDIDVHGYG
jgi:hypothetical protein